MQLPRTVVCFPFPGQPQLFLQTRMMTLFPTRILFYAKLNGYTPSPPHLCLLVTL